MKTIIIIIAIGLNLLLSNTILASENQSMNEKFNKIIQAMQNKDFFESNKQLDKLYQSIKSNKDYLGFYYEVKSYNLQDQGYLQEASTYLKKSNEIKSNIKNERFEVYKNTRDFYHPYDYTSSMEKSELQNKLNPINKLDELNKVIEEIKKIKSKISQIKDLSQK